jgi:protein phosphatase
MKESVQVDIATQEPEHEDIFLLCSDGLSGMVTDNEMRDILAESSADLEAACNRLIQKANEAGGTDNITVVLTQYLKD